MTWTARAREITRQTDSFVEQTVRFLLNGNPVKDVSVQYAPGADAATANANLAAAVNQLIASRAADGSTVAVVPGTTLDLSTPAPTPPTQADTDRGTWQTAYLKVLAYQRGLAAGVKTQSDVDAAKAALAQLAFVASYEAML